MTHTRFPRVSRLRRGYHCKQVEAFLARVEVSLDGSFPPMAAGDIRRAGFELVRHGYAVDAVDGYLDGLEDQVLAVEGVTGGRRARTDPETDRQFLREQLDKPYMRRFPRAGLLRRGYHLDQVDEFVDQVIAHLEGTAELTVEDVRSAGFRPRRGGYAEAAVDETLDRVVDVLLVQRRPGGSVVAGRTDEPDVDASGPAS
jgi:DivIVA domain-containing protein